MKEIGRNLIAHTADTFTKKFLDDLAMETKFIQREGYLKAKDFVSLCVFSKEFLCSSSLSQLCSDLLMESNIKISPQALNERFKNIQLGF